MHYSHSYVDELEFFISLILPGYIENQIAKGDLDPTKNFNPKLMKLMLHKKPVAALFRPSGYNNYALDPKLQ